MGLDLESILPTPQYLMANIIVTMPKLFNFFNSPTEYIINNFTLFNNQIKKMSLIYLDYNATTPIDVAVSSAMIPYMTQHFGNPSSSHHYGTITKKAVTRSRIQVSQLLNCHPDEVIFTRFVF